MGKSGTGTKHHCPGKFCPVGNIPAGNRRGIRVGNKTNAYCNVHEMPCPRGKDDKQCKWFCLRNQRGCLACRKAHDMQIVHEKEEMVAIKAGTNKDPDWFKDNSNDRKPRRQ